MSLACSGHIIVADTFNNRMMLFDEAGKVLGPFYSSSSLYHPSAVVELEHGGFAVKDNNSISVFSSEFECCKVIAKGKLSRPYGELFIYLSLFFIYCCFSFFNHLITKIEYTVALYCAFLPLRSNRECRGPVSDCRDQPDWQSDHCHPESRLGQCGVKGESRLGSE